MLGLYGKLLMQPDFILSLHTHLTTSLLRHFVNEEKRISFRYNTCFINNNVMFLFGLKLADLVETIKSRQFLDIKKNLKMLKFFHVCQIQSKNKHITGSWF